MAPYFYLQPSFVQMNSMAQGYIDQLNLAQEEAQYSLYSDDQLNPAQEEVRYSQYLDFCPM